MPFTGKLDGNIVVVGLQWGDEGKGKVVDRWAAAADAVVRYAGGANAGHTLQVGDETKVLHLVPSGALHTHLVCVVGQGTVIDPAVLLEEVEWMRRRGLLAWNRLRLSDRAHVVLPHHKVVDALRESGARPIGTTRRGIGPCYEDKAGRRGVRIEDLLRPERLRQLVEAAQEHWRPWVEARGGELPDVEETVRHYAALGERLAPHVCDTSRWVDDALRSGKKVLFEGAQGVMLDVDHGTWPFVTSSYAVAGGAAVGAGLGPQRIDRVVGVAKAYTTRVGRGPFPTEMEDPLGERLREAGGEYGATTGRPRRCGWLDLVALRYAVQVSGIDWLALTKLDVLDGFDELRLCVGYEGVDVAPGDFPARGLADARPVYETLPGWTGSVQGCAERSALPGEARAYLERIERFVGVPIGYVGLGAARGASLGTADVFAEA